MLGGRRRSGRRDTKLVEEKKDEKDKEGEEDITRISGWKWLIRRMGEVGVRGRFWLLIFFGLYYGLFKFCYSCH